MSRFALTNKAIAGNGIYRPLQLLSHFHILGIRHGSLSLWKVELFAPVFRHVIGMIQKVFQHLLDSQITRIRFQWRALTSMPRCPSARKAINHVLASTHLASEN